MRKILLVVLFLTVTLSSCKVIKDEINYDDITDETISEEETIINPTPNQTVSREPKNESDNESDNSNGFGFNINLEMPGTVFYFNRQVSRAHRFFYDGGEVTVNIIAENHQSGVMSTGIIVLCDGIPVESRLDSDEETHLIHYIGVEDITIQKLSFTPQFYEGLGRIDFYLLFNTDLKNGQIFGPMSGMTFVLMADLPESYESFSHSSVWVELQPIREMVKFLFIKSTDPSFEGNQKSSWVTPISIYDPEKSGIYQTASWELDNIPKIQYESGAVRSGWYRTIFFLDFEPFAFDGENYVIDYMLEEGEMLSMEIDLDGYLDDGPVSFFSIVTEMEPDTPWPSSGTSMRYELKP